MSDLSFNNAADAVIRKLMTQSTWGRKKTAQDLLSDFYFEFKELEDGMLKGDIINCFEEVADVLMLMLCALYKMAPNEDEYISTIIRLMNEKINRRYGSVFSNFGTAQDLDIIEESAIWKQAKKEEHQNYLLFCPNPMCELHCSIDKDNLVTHDKEAHCNKCGHDFFISSKNVLLGELGKNRRHCLSQIGIILKDFIAKKHISSIMISENKDVFEAIIAHVLGDEQKQTVLIKYFEEYYHFKKENIIAFISEVGRSKIPKNHSYQLLNNYIKGYLTNDLSNNNLTITDIKKIIKQLSSIRFPLFESVEKELYFSAKSWNTQITKKLLLSIDDRRIIECMSIVHMLDEQVRDLTFELSNMYGCPVGCGFCASGELNFEAQKLTAIDFIKQINSLRDETGFNPNDFEHFYVSFAGIGEPSLLYDEVSSGMSLIEELYPFVKFNIATIGFNPECFEYWKKRNNKIRTIQIPFYSANPDVICKLVKNLPIDYDLQNVLKRAIDYKATHPKCRIKVNYIVFSDFNDSTNDIKALCNNLNMFKNDIEIKVSYLNDTNPSKKLGLCSPNEIRMAEIQNMLANNGFISYIFGTKNNPILGCGQLVQNHLEENGK